MSKIISFEDWWVKLTENDLWWDRIKIKFPRKNLKSVGEDCYTRLLTQPNRLHSGDVADWQKAMWNHCVYAKDEPIKPQLQQEETKEPEAPVVQVSPEEHARRLREWKEKVLSQPFGFQVPKLTKQEYEEEGQVRPKKKIYKPVLDTYEILLKEAIDRVRVEKYEGNRSIDGFALHRVGLHEIFCKSKDDAAEILVEAETRVNDYIEKEKAKRV